MKNRFFRIITLVTCLIIACTLLSCSEDSPSEPNPVQLDAVADITFDNENDRLFWTPVTNAGSYSVSINGETASITQSNSFAYDAYNKGFSVTITANPSNETTHSTSRATTKSFSFLNKVENIKIVDGTISWDAVQGATSYDVYLNDTIAGTVNSTTFNNLTANVDYRITIVPKNDGDNNHGYFSERSNQFDGRIAAAPVLKFENSTTMVYWNAVDGAAGYILKVSHNGKTIQQTLGSNTTSYIDNFINAGVYTISVQTTSDKSRTDFYDSGYSSIQITRLPEVENIKTSYPQEEANNTIYISFDDVPGASYFEVKEGQITITQKKRTTFEYTFVRSVEEVNHELVIYSKGDGDRILDSYTGKKFTLTKLAMPQNIKVNNDLIVWDAVNKNNGYRVVIDGVEYNADANQLQVPTLESGAHQIIIAARGNGESIVASDFCNAVNILRLQKPQNLHIENNILYWDAVQFCQSYQVQIGEFFQQVGTNSFAIDDSYIGQSTTIKVKAISNETYILESALSETLPLSRLSAPENLKTNNDYISWSAVPNASYYRVHLNHIVKNVTAENLSWADIPSGDYNIKVYAIGDGCKFFTSSYSNEITIRKLETPTVNVLKTSGYTWQSISMSSGYEILDGGNCFTLDKFETNYMPTYTTIGVKNIEVRALGDGVKTVASSWAEASHEVTAETQPSSFTVTRVGGVFTISIDFPVEGKTYLFNIGGTIKEGVVSQTAQIANAGAFSVCVATKGDGFNTIDSPYSFSQTYTILNKVSSKEVYLIDEGDDYFTVTWNNVMGACGYTIKIQKTKDDGTVEEEIVREKSAAQTNHGIDMLGYRSVKITIIVKGDGVSTFDSAETVVVEYI